VTISFSRFITDVDENGSPLFRFVKRKLHQFPPGFAITSRSGIQSLVSWGVVILRGNPIARFCICRVKRDARDNAFKLIECIHRFGTGIELLTAAGIDAPLITYTRALGQPVSALRSYRRGVRLCTRSTTHVPEESASYRPLLGYAVLCILFAYQYFVGTTRSQLSCLTGFF
jgi:predicted ATP-grasp superfamily ATP-dependent carboligase